MLLIYTKRLQEGKIWVDGELGVLKSRQSVKWSGKMIRKALLKMQLVNILELPAS